jgi:stage II sporulation protein D
VLLIDDVAECQLVVEEPVELVESESGRVLVGDVGQGELTFSFTESAIRWVEKDRVFKGGSVDVVGCGSKGLGVRYPDGLRKFRGSLRLLLGADGVGSVINIVDVEDYLVGVVAAELDRSFHREAFRAQAIIARTYVWYHRQQVVGSREWDVKSTEGSQVYRGMEREIFVPQATSAVDDTRGLVCTWSGPEGAQIFGTYYSSRCGGVTQAAGPVIHERIIPPLAGGVVCKYCRESPYVWGPVKLVKSEITERLRERYARFQEIGPIDSLEVLSATADGRLVMLSLLDAEGRSIKLEAENFRLAVDPGGRRIKSTFFVPVVGEDSIMLTDGRGFGHGMGLCQYGANKLAKDGKTAGQILQYYYPTSKLSRAYE